MRWAALGALSAGVAVAAGAFGAHALRGVLAPASAAVYETAVRYQLVHALALIAVGLAAGRIDARGARRTGLLFALGTVFFCGSLYALALGGPRVLGAVAPLGGLCWLGAWVDFASGFARSNGGPAGG
jgi:uncharacterized membrane protein YgdD (TMEM256/DUF423 family)